jgi:hypothetical protein
VLCLSSSPHPASHPLLHPAPFLLQVFSDNYPERLGAMYVFPAGLLASTVFKMVSPLMEARTASKVRPSHSRLV